VNDEDKSQSDETIEETDPTDAVVEVEEDGEGESLAEEETTEVTLEARLAEVEALAAEYLDGWQRSRAELANYKKRIDRERTQWADTVTIEVINLFLPAIDDMERALGNLPPEVADEPWLEGIKLIYRKLLATLEALNVTEIEAEGQFFDPALHEAVTHEESDAHEEGQIIGVIQKGYMLNDRVVRPARVRVAS
jgi:molecular chaperone GrpE